VALVQTQMVAMAVLHQAVATELVVTAEQESLALLLGHRSNTLVVVAVALTQLAERLQAVGVLVLLMSQVRATLTASPELLIEAVAVAVLQDL
jgi:hypothetical protein